MNIFSRPLYRALFLLYQKTGGDEREKIPNVVPFVFFGDSELCWAKESIAFYKANASVKTREEVKEFGSRSRN